MEMKNIKFDYYHYIDDEEPCPKLSISLDWFKYEDCWHRFYSGDSNIEQKKKLNLNRHVWLGIYFKIGGHRLSCEVRLNKIGLLCSGRVRENIPEDEKHHRLKRRKSFGEGL